MNLELTGKRALIADGGCGMGAECARVLAREGVAVVVHGRDDAEAIAKEIAEAGGKSAVTHGNFEEDEDADWVAAEALGAFGGIDILVNNAGPATRPDNADWTAVSTADWLRSFGANTVSAVRLSQKLAPAMAGRGWGRIINLSAVAAYQPDGEHLEYGSAKAAMHNVTLGLSRLLSPRGVTVNTIVAGAILTPQMEQHLDSMCRRPGWAATRAENERLYATSHRPQPIARLGRPSEIAAAVAMIASPRSDYTTGSMLRIDGGVSKAL